MRIPKFIPPDELPPYVQVRTFSGDLVTVDRPKPVDPELQSQTGMAVAVGLLVAGAVAHFSPDEPLGFTELAPVARWINMATPTHRSTFDFILQLVLIGLTYGAVLRLGFWLLWRFELMRYAAKVEDETT